MTTTAPTAEQRLSWIEQLLAIFWDGGDTDSLMWHPSNGGIFVRVPGEPPQGEISFAVMCSDTFEWGCADAEEIVLPDDLPSLRQALDDANAVEVLTGVPSEEMVWVDWTILWCCRKRGMRPMPAWIKKHAKREKEQELYYACGPERTPQFGAS